MSDYSFGINFLKQWYSSAFRGVITFQGVLSRYTQAQIESLGRMARNLPLNRWKDAIDLANKDFKGASVPSKSYWNSYILAVGGNIDYGKIAGEVAIETIDFMGNLSKYSLIAIAVGGIAALLVYSGGLGKIKNAWKN